MAFKHCFRRRRRMRKPVRRFRRRCRMRRRVLRSKPGNMLTKLTKITTLSVENNINATWSCSFKMGDFTEYGRLAPNFETVKLNKVVVRVQPLQNVANNSTSSVPAYVVVPWHYNIALPKDFASYLSIDKHKLRTQTVGTSMSFVPNIVTVGVANEGANPTGRNITWKPTLECLGVDINIPRVYCGAIRFQGQPDMEGRKTAFNIITDVYCTFRNQNTMKV
ncbi:capsid protein [Cyclovirus Chimp12]|nr:capsid protein [Cyclovirus Chimp12]